jgi:quinol monooxygenase YgiN
MAVTLGVLALLEAKPEKGPDLAAFLESGRALAAAELGTVTWYAFKVDETTYGIFDTFETDDARNAHLEGEIPRALAQVGPDLLAKDPDIRLIDILAVK